MKPQAPRRTRTPKQLESSTTGRPRFAKEAAEPAHCYVMCVDLVGYSDLKGSQQVTATKDLITHVRAVLKATPELRPNFVLPTGDGMIMGFDRSPIKPLALAKALHARYGAKRSALKIGINAGLAFPITDILGRPNYAGSGINYAQRIESCCSPGHILVKYDSNEVHDLDHEWTDALGSPYTFRVKHGRFIRAYNFCDRRRGRFGSAAEPKIGRVFDEDYKNLQDLLERHGAVAAAGLQRDGLRAALKGHVIIDQSILDHGIAGFGGVAPELISVTLTLEPQYLPDAAQDAKKSLPEPASNRRKVYLRSWTPPKGDEADRTTMEVGYSDYWARKAIEKAAPSIHQLVEEGQLDVFSFPKQLCCHILAVTADNMVVLARRSEHVDVRQLQWGITIGESMDAERDQTKDQSIPHPGHTVRAALGRSEELGLRNEHVRDADVRFVALITEWDLLLAVLVAFVKLPIGFKQVADSWNAAHDGRGEIKRLTAIPFNAEQCLPLVLSGKYRCPGDHSEEDRIYGTSRLALLACLCAEYGYHDIRDALDHA